ncbi:hypothetical protein [Ralstonia solanacearum]|uniref:hypothetical protein n=1 Tax=Ralstonia solanacearum TaxID=305 RepID=UPI0011C3DDAE|nr:hypothetical protein [Ralstonia solanacearum]QOK81515.1 hypothetical protein HF906_04670 [Ralstonia solanacearum]
MLGINGEAAQDFYSRAPQTFRAMQHLVMALDDCAKNVGKKTWFGRDKTQDALVALGLNMARTITAMRADGVLFASSPASDVHSALRNQVFQFFEVAPTWTRAASFAAAFFADKSSMDIVEGLPVLESERPPRGTALERAHAAADPIIIAAYREIAQRSGGAPSAKTSDEEIVALYGRVGRAFAEVAKQRNERLSAGSINMLVLYFLQVKEDHPPNFFEEHLQYELEKYQASGLRESYQRELNLFHVLGLEGTS